MIYAPSEPQQQIDRHLEECNNALLFVGMGLGKTAACLARLHRLFRDGDAFAALVVAPLRVANLTWPMEVQQWFPWMRVANLRTEAGQRAFLNGKAHIYTINYEAMSTLVSLVERRGARGLPYDVAIFDELTRAKNPSSKRINLFRRKVPRAERNWGLTGTPMPNSWLDLFAQVRLVDGGERFGNHYLTFKKEFFYGSEFNHFSAWKPKAGTTQKLEERLSDITLTLRSSDWLDIPDTVVEDVDIQLPADLREKYDRLQHELVLELTHGTDMNVASAAALVTKLLQFTSGHVYDEDRTVHSIHNLKFDALRRIATEETKPLLVACIYQHEQDEIRRQFPEARFFADAKTILAQERLMVNWNMGRIQMLVAHPASVGHGLNLQHGSSVMVWTTLTYSREQYEQMIARLARRGQKDVVTVYRLMCPDTVDDAVATALEAKAGTEARLIKALQMLESLRVRKGVSSRPPKSRLLSTQAHRAEPEE